MSPASTEQVLRNQRVDAIVELFAAGYTLDYACEQGVTGGWTRADVVTVVKQRGWPLDGSGRLPLRMRPQRRAARPQRFTGLPPQLEAIARYDEAQRAKAVDPAPTAAPEPAEPLAPPARPRQPATSPADVSEAVERFLAEQTVPTPDDQYLTGPELRDAYETWRVTTDAPVVTPRWFGVVLTSKYRKKQAVTKIDGAKPVCYYGIAWKPAVTEKSSGLPRLGRPSGAHGHADAGPEQQPDRAVVDGGDLQVAELAGVRGGLREVDDVESVGSGEALHEIEADAGVVDHCGHDNTSSAGLGSDAIDTGEFPTTVDAQTPTEGTAPGTIGADAAGTAPEPSGSGHGIAGPDAQPQVSPSRSHSGEGGGLGVSDAPAEPPAAEPLADWERHFVEDWVWNADTKSYEFRGPQSTSPAPPSVLVEKEDTAQVSDPSRAAVDVLALGLAHAHPAVRAKAKRVQSAIDDLFSALARHRGAAS